ncbi:Cyclic nucleotide-binding domain-containing protein 2 [Trichoplax sp. H2]|nr:Cyclic nucleotide-binding domain-containing protein 2 [Trichoplax sp. H2]|eukprot:RDD43582.1 Cyclic nucleotide-binding domain-containing protein 2 [Trichoplax sp. H2]
MQRIVNRREQRNSMSFLQLPDLPLKRQKSHAMSLVSKIYKRKSVRNYWIRRELSLRRLFRRKVRIMIMIFKCYFESRQRLHKIYWPLDEVNVLSEESVPEIQLDDLDSFRRRQHGVKFSSRGKNVLNTNPSERTLEMIEQLRALMQSVIMFARWPVYVQREFCKVAWYDSFDKDRVIIRKGHRSDCLFFVLSGTLMQDRGDDDRLFYMQQKLEGKLHFNVHDILFDGENRDELQYGHSFGLEDIYYSTERSATVFTKEDVELFVIHVKDYGNIFKNFMKRSDKTLDICRQVYALSDWPVDVLYKDPHSWIMQNFTRGSVICPNCADSQWVYVITSGKCKVIKYLTTTELERYKEVLRERRTLENRKALASFIGDKSPNYGSSRSRADSVYKIPSNTPSKLNNDYGWTNEVWDDEDNWYERHAAGRGNEPLPSVVNSKLPKSTSYYRRSSTSSNKSRVTINSTIKYLPTYIELKTLRTREAFGIEPIIYPADKEFSASISLISDGAECILIPRRIFRDHLSVTKVGIMQIKVERFPDCKQLVESLMESMRWKNYKGELVTNVLRRIDDKKLR